MGTRRLTSMKVRLEVYFQGFQGFQGLSEPPNEAPVSSWPYDTCIHQHHISDLQPYYVSKAWYAHSTNETASN